jgi:DNA-binding NtrC family response regulator
VSHLSQGQTILVVEDDPAILPIVRLVLQEADYTVLVARTAREALRVQQQSGPFHLLLADMNLPDGSGEELAGRLARALPGLKTLLMTGGANPPGSYPSIEKPFRFADLLDMVRQLLHQP